MPPTRLPSRLMFQARAQAYAPRCKSCGVKLPRGVSDFCEKCVVLMWATAWANANPF